MCILYFCSNKNFEERESSIEILSKVVLKVFLWKQTYGLRKANGVKDFLIGGLVNVFS
jgi:hypothetical protein